ncbi:MAG TPA: OB-fold nucleic acid binding domain-containing protein, partial [Gammaproteobacteria bacterium]|nr:OB-fold nucleic acid binding domain-containing protein [Gammaproteobacteria bacterium]
MKQPRTPSTSPVMRADTAVRYLYGVGPHLAEKLGHLGIYNIADLLFHLPRRYEDRTHITPLGALQAGMRTAVECRVELTETVIRRRRMLLCRVSDGSGVLTLRFFHFNQSQAEALSRGTRLRCYGEVVRGVSTLEMVHPEYKVLQEGQS